MQDPDLISLTRKSFLSTGKSRKVFTDGERIDEEEFDYLNQTLEKPADKAAFLAGKQCILYYPGFQVPDGYVGEKNIHFSCGGKQFSISIAAVCHEWYYGGTRNIGPNLIVSQDYLESLGNQLYTLNLNIKYRETYDKTTEGKNPGADRGQFQQQ